MIAAAFAFEWRDEHGLDGGDWKEASKGLRIGVRKPSETSRNGVKNPGKRAIYADPAGPMPGSFPRRPRPA
jgi:hypothetical protein